MTIAYIPSTDGVEVALHDLGGVGPALLMVHANGMHGRVWQPVADALAADARCWAIDLRGHGVSRTPDNLAYEWDGVGDDVSAVVDHLYAAGHAEPGQLDGVGWSMGGCGLMLAEQAVAGRFRSLWAFEPIVFPAEAARPAGAPNPLADSARRRREIFASRDEAFENYAAKPPFSTTDPASLRAYVEHGFGDLDDGTVQLRCRGATEAAFFSAEHGEVFANLGAIATPTTVVGSGDGGPPSMIAPTVAEHLLNGFYVSMADLNHFGPMQDPARIAASIRKALPR
ncbi:MAG: alpha/beta hydrolase [Acidimicrobiales bacterium]|nr:alpha/beta hydrolase [Acidimicrobiales bacterium]